MKGLREHKTSKTYFRVIYFKWVRKIDKISAKVFNFNYGNKVCIPTPSRIVFSNVVAVGPRLWNKS